MLYCTVEGFKAQQTALKHSKKLEWTAENFTAQKLEKSQSYGRNWRKVPFAAETREKFLLQQKLEKSFFCGRSRGQAPRSACCKRALGRRGTVCAQAGSNWVTVRPVSTPLLRILRPNTAGGSPAHFNHKKAHHNV